MLYKSNTFCPVHCGRRRFLSKITFFCFFRVHVITEFISELVFSDDASSCRSASSGAVQLRRTNGLLPASPFARSSSLGPGGVGGSGGGVGGPPDSSSDHIARLKQQAASLGRESGFQSTTSLNNGVSGVASVQGSGRTSPAGSMASLASGFASNQSFMSPLLRGAGSRKGATTAASGSTRVSAAARSSTRGRTADLRGWFSNSHLCFAHVLRLLHLQTNSQNFVTPGGLSNLCSSRCLNVIPILLSSDASGFLPKFWSSFRRTFLRTGE